ncbi:DUF732 domain-containing protein [Williamsia sp. CHRR-6]|uniref:DUF732 domain-containing protein n=1 Tax=Williamsia sp. CHRR-6 TaxID=2835871 RepID=UPI001BDA5784|nr:DUF732 domain-containing protein [Williamsia sp. CHRR-6]MBT0566235.1 DUF732 domain-containing protein [Williamsia sp. CHRR-6]
MKKIAIGLLAATTLVLAGCSDSKDSNDSNPGAAASKAVNSLAAQASAAASGVADGAANTRDAGFAAAVSASGLTLGDQKQTVAAAEKACTTLADSTLADAVDEVKDKYDGDTTKATNFIRLAVPVYCAGQLGKVIG